MIFRRFPTFTLDSKLNIFHKFSRYFSTQCEEHYNVSIIPILIQKTNNVEFMENFFMIERIHHFIITHLVEFRTNTY